MAWGLPESAVVCHLGDILKTKLNEKRVRTIGRLVDQNIHDQTVLLTSPIKGCESDQLTVSVKLVYPFQASIGSLYEVIGEVIKSTEGTSLRAHSWRCMDGLDIFMFYQVVQRRRDYFQSRSLKDSQADKIT
ncbi:CST complex subunit TEN1 [Holothuria leucospilota]|uniref:CST complex subunit TEN1 n=1 Tax=Holothuria leucospilota TaxID=206669 RepID=A0A9Q1BYD5_HOLLE|nr:CST complex subunit TEN1 [Holothuria leucospilota]